MDNCDSHGQSRNTGLEIKEYMSMAAVLFFSYHNISISYPVL